MPKLDKQSPAELQVFLWLVEGQREEHITEAVAAHFPKAKAPQLIERARARMQQLAAEGPDPAWCLAAMQDLYRRAVGMGELALALRILKELKAIRPAEDDADGW